jgi:recombination-promoting nuclease RpnB
VTITIHQPHDTLFRSFLTDSTKARDLLEQYLPQRIKGICDFNTLKLEPGSFIDKHLKKHFSDILYSIQIRGKKAFIYTLIEHLTNPDPLIPFKLLRYQVPIMQQHLDNNYDKLPIVVPILFYRGNVSPYPFSMSIFDCYEKEDKKLAQELFLNPILVDITVIPDEELRTHKSIALLEIIQKNIHRRDAIEFIKDIVAQLAKRFLTHEQFQGLLYYMSQEGESKNFEQFYSTLAAALPNYREDIMTLAQQLEQKGLQKGLQQGREEGRHAGEHDKAVTIARNMLTEGMSLQTVQKLTGLAEEVVIDLVGIY